MTAHRAGEHVNLGPRPEKAVALLPGTGPVPGVAGTRWFPEIKGFRASVGDLKGKTIAVPGLAGALYGSLIVTLHSAGLSSTDAKIVQVPFANMFDQLKSGQIAAALTIVPFTGQMKAAGFTQLSDPVMETTGNQPTPSAMWSASSSWAAANGATIAKFRTANQQALDWIKANDQAARQILVTSFHLPEAVAKIYPITTFFSFTVTAQSLANWIQPLETVGLLQKGTVTSTQDLVLSGA
jgi:NitT/TauT family transport system substrate-binding protein